MLAVMKVALADWMVELKVDLLAVQKVDARVEWLVYATVVN